MQLHFLYMHRWVTLQKAVDPAQYCWVNEKWGKLGDRFVPWRSLLCHGCFPGARYKLTEATGMLASTRGSAPLFTPRVAAPPFWWGADHGFFSATGKGLEGWCNTQWDQTKSFKVTNTDNNLIQTFILQLIPRGSKGLMHMVKISRVLTPRTRK